MNALLLTGDDGISADIWLTHAKAYLGQNRQILAISEADNTEGVIGIGDGLPCYGPELKAHAEFFDRKVGPDDAIQIISEIKKLPFNAVVMWNMSVFEWAVRDARWKEVLDTCVSSTCDVIFTHYAYRSWSHGRTAPEELLVGAVPWDYVAGTRIFSGFNTQFVRGMLPHLARELDQLSRVKSCSRTGRWEVVRRGRSTVTVGAWQELPGNAEILRSLASCDESREAWGSRIVRRLGLR